MSDQPGPKSGVSNALQRWTLALLLCLLGAGGLDASAPRSVDLDAGSRRFEGALVREAAAPSVQQLFRFVLRDKPEPETPDTPDHPAAAPPAPLAAPPAARLSAPAFPTWRHPLPPARRPQSPRAPPLHS